ncbi:MAG: RidA family protein [SAR202 cluster bacterium]|nr:RidA family protein [SAR202 cluster bacterium]
MTIVRNNHSAIYPAGPTYVRAIRAGNTLYLSGVTARYSKADGGPPMEQLRVCLERITRVVEAEGGTSANIVMLTTYLVNMKDYWPIDDTQKAIWDEFFPRQQYPTNSYVEVRALAEPGLHIEITAQAVLGS